MRKAVHNMLIAAAMLAIMACSVWQKPVAGDEVLFTVDGEPVGVEEFRYVYEKNNYDNEKLYAGPDVREYLDMFIRFKLKVHEAEQLGYDTAASFVEEYQTYRKQLAAPLLTEARFQEQLIEEAYERLQYEVRASHILIRIPKNATAEDTLKAYNKISEIRVQALSGADFEALAKKYSEDPSARSNGGDLGYFSAFQMVYPFETAAYTTETGSISDIVRSSFGYHIVKVTDKRPSPGKVKVAHILLRVKPDKSDSTAVAERAFEVYDQLAGGADWDVLCARYSEDTRTRQNGGSLPYLTHGQIDPAFLEMAFSITEPGGISDPFVTRYGWHILRLEDRQEVGTLDEMRDEIEARVRRDERAVASKSRMLDQLSNKLALEVDQTALEYVMLRADSTLLDGKWRFDVRQTSLQDTLFKTAHSAGTLVDFLRYVQENQRVRKNIAPEDYMHELYEDYLYQCLLEDEMDALSDRDAEFRYLLNEYYEGILLFNIMEDKVWSRATTDSIGLHRFFEEHRDGFLWKERARATIYKASDPDAIDSIARYYADRDTIALQTLCIAKEDDAAAMLSSLEEQVQDADELLYLLPADTSDQRIGSLRNLLNASGVEDSRIVFQARGPVRDNVCITAASTSKKSLEWIFRNQSDVTLEVREGLFERGEEDVLDSIRWEAGRYRLSANDGYYLIILYNIVDPAPKDFDEVKGGVISAYQDYLEQKWIEELKQKYAVEVHEKVLKRLL